MLSHTHFGEGYNLVRSSRGVGRRHRGNERSGLDCRDPPASTSLDSVLSVVLRLLDSMELTHFRKRFEVSIFPSISK